MRKRVDGFKGSRTHGGSVIKRLPRRRWFPKGPGEKPFDRWLSQNLFQISNQRWTLRDHSEQLQAKGENSSISPSGFTISYQ